MGGIYTGFSENKHIYTFFLLAITRTSSLVQPFLARTYNIRSRASPKGRLHQRCIITDTHGPRATSSTQALPDDATPQAEAPGGELQLPYIPYANIRGGYEPNPKRVSYIFIPIYHYGDGGIFGSGGAA